jgi:molybdate transport system substrate-binding protein
MNGATRRASSTGLLGAAAALSMIMLAALVVGNSPSRAAEIRVFTSGAPAEVQKILARPFTAATGHRVLFTVGNLSAIQDKLATGESPDVVVFPAPAIETLSKAGKLRPGSQLALARVGIGVAVRQGAPLPDVSTVEGVRKTLLEARSIVHPDPQGGGFTGAHIARVMVRLGIADAVKPKITLLFAIGGGVAAVAKGDAEIGLFNVSEIVPIPGVTLAGPFPAELQNYLTFAGALHADSVSPEPAAAFLRSLTEPGARDAWQTGGFEPLGGGP